MAASRIMKSLVTGYAVLSIPDFEIGRSHILHVYEEIGPLSSPQSLSSDPGKSHAAEVIWAHSFFDPSRLSDPGKSHAAEVTRAYSFFDPFSLYDPGKSHAAEVIWAHSFFDPFRLSDPGKSHAAEVTRAYSFFDPFSLYDPGKSHAAEVIWAHSFFDPFRLSDPGKSHAAEVTRAYSFFDPFSLSDPGKSHAAEVTGALFRPFNPVKFHDPEDPDKYGYVQSHCRGFDTGMSGAGAGKEKDGEPTKDDERTLAWKLRLSVKAVTPKFSASAKISLEKKSG